MSGFQGSMNPKLWTKLCVRACGCTLFWGEGLSLLWDTCGGPWPQKVRTPVLEHQGWEELQDSVGSTPAFTKEETEAQMETCFVQGHPGSWSPGPGP